MQWLMALAPGQFLALMLLFVRMSGLVFTAPVFGGPEIPAQVRGLMSLALAAVCWPMVHGAAIPQGLTLVDFFILVAQELLIGLFLGVGVSIFLSGAYTAGEAIGRMGGLMAADLFDPSTESYVPLFSRLLSLATLACLVLLGGHRMIIGALLDTLESLPPGGGLPTDSPGKALVLLLDQSFHLGMRAALPTLCALMLATVLLGLIGRAVPQLNILLLGFGVNSLLTFGVLALTFGAALWVFQDQWEWAVDFLLEALQNASSPVIR
ncbi:MAG TPA: flagellar biosynthetic protein FliR [Thermoguttaceae bacterium]|jgi:flagellar biosynthetic protein FliR|nr:flagellar biosynthetic protein FliR [Thermoguttaceae bacterium]HPP52630.1 flagellar biosynthetic protein FliR [Thermoguttaceae bacterium]